MTPAGGLTLLFVAVPICTAAGLAAPHLALVAPAVAGVAALRRRARPAGLHPAAEAATVIAGALLAVVVGAAERSPTHGLATFLLVAGAAKALTQVEPQRSGLAAVVALVLTAVSAAEGVEASFAPVLALTLVAWAFYGGSLATPSLPRAPSGCRPRPGDGGSWPAAAWA